MIGNSKRQRRGLATNTFWRSCRDRVRCWGWTCRADCFVGAVCDWPDHDELFKACL